MTESITKGRTYAIVQWPLSVTKARVYAIVIPDSIITKANHYVVTGQIAGDYMAKVNHYIVVGPPGSGTPAAKKRRSLMLIGE